MVVCIAGMHRSGTSMVARLLNLCGIYLGEEKDLIPAAQDNLEGFWENIRFQNVNEEILSSFGGGWDLPPKFVDGWEESRRLAPVRERSKDLLGEFSRYPVWGWKDPRSSLTLPFWKTLIPDLKVVVCLRNPYDVFRSLARRGYASSTFSYDLWLKYYQQLLAATDPGSRIVTHFESYFHDPQSEIKRLIDYLGMDVSTETITNACKTISLDLRHSHGNTSDLLNTKASYELLHVYHDLCIQAGDVYRSSLSPGEQEVIESANSISTSILTDYEKLLIRNKIESQERIRLAERLAQKEEMLVQKEEMLVQKEEVLAQKDGEITRLRTELTGIFESRSWRLIRIFQRVRENIFPPAGIRGKVRFGDLAKIPSILAREGVGGLQSRMFNRVNTARPVVVIPEAVEQVYTDLLLTASGKAKKEYVPLVKENISSNEALVKLIAFYLPQFHPIPENDAWWGRGFTEWTNVSKATPQFFGHYQTHLPGELGFYDLRLPEVEERQVELARKYGIHGFTFYYYWFNGKRLLEKPLENYLGNPNIDFPFCICWANENWTRRWDGLENDILIAQKHTPESDLGFIRDLVPILKDSRYIRINGRPLIIIYRASLLPEPARTAQRWREYCKEQGLGDPYLVTMQAFGFEDPRETGFDAIIEFPPLDMKQPVTLINGEMKIVNPDYKGRIYSYYDAIRDFGYRALPEYKVFRGVFPNWDNEARKPGRGDSFAFSTPHAYQHWLTQVSQETINNEPDPAKRLVFINAWNEWAEGAHLEPDRRYGYAYLSATANALHGLNEKEDPRVGEEKRLFGQPVIQRHGTAVFLHLFYPDLLDEILENLNNLEGDFDLFVSIPTIVDLDVQKIISYHADTYIYRCENRGRDVNPFLRMFNAVARHGYQQGLKLHTKKSTHRQDGDVWRIDLYQKLMGSPEIVRKVREALEQNITRGAGIVAPEGHVVSSRFYLALNKEKINTLAQLANIPYWGEEFNFVAGSMFWFKMDSLFPLCLLPIDDEDFEEEQGQVDGTLAHAYERIFGLITTKTGYKLYVSDGNSVYQNKTTITPKIYAHARPHVE